MYNIKNIRGMDFSELAETFGIRHSDDENEYNKNIRAFIIIAKNTSASKRSESGR